MLAWVRSPVGTSFLGEVFSGFSSPVRQISGSFRPPRTPNIIWLSLSSSSIIIHYGRQWPEMLTRPKTSNIHTYIHTYIHTWHFKMFGSFSPIRTRSCHEKKHFVMINTLWPQQWHCFINNYIIQYDPFGKTQNKTAIKFTMKVI